MCKGVEKMEVVGVGLTLERHTVEQNESLSYLLMPLSGLTGSVLVLHDLKELAKSRL